MYNIYIDLSTLSKAIQEENILLPLPLPFLFLSSFFFSLLDLEGGRGT